MLPRKFGKGYGSIFNAPPLPPTAQVADLEIVIPYEQEAIMDDWSSTEG